MAAGLAPLLPDILQHGDEDAKEAAVWCVINLTTSGAEHPGAVKRVAALREAGADLARRLPYSCVPSYRPVL